MSGVRMACLTLSACAIPLAAAATVTDPGGPVAAEEWAHLHRVVLWTMVAVAPVLVGVPLLLWRYRYRGASGTAAYRPRWTFNWIVEIAAWGVPLTIIAILGWQLWHSVYRLDPYRRGVTEGTRLPVQVVGLDWKWLFIYPEQGIASVGELVFPQGDFLALDLTTDTVMQSFAISSLSGQIYAMPGMVTQLHLSADAPGTFEGENMQYSGDGFWRQKFTARAVPRPDFDAWVERVRAQGVPLDAASYDVVATRGTRRDIVWALGLPASEGDVIHFASVPDGWFDRIVSRYHVPALLPPEDQPGTNRFGRPSGTADRDPGDPTVFEGGRVDG